MATFINRATLANSPELRSKYEAYAKIDPSIPKVWNQGRNEHYKAFALWLDAGCPSAAPAAPATAESGELATALQTALKLAGFKAEIDYDLVQMQVDSAVAEAIKKIEGRTLKIVRSGQPDRKVESSFDGLPTVLQALENNQNVWLFGPSGSGKTTLAEKAIAKAFGFEKHEVAVVSCYYQLAKAEIFGGALNATTWTDGALKGRKLVIFDEITKLHPSVAGALNHLLQEREYIDPKTGEVISVADVKFVATSNILFGESAVYNGNSKQDASLMQRFAVKLFVGYNEKYETQVCDGLPNVLKAFRTLRSRCMAAKLPDVISTRDLQNIVQLVASGISAVNAFDTVLGIADTDEARAYGMGWSVDKLTKVNWTEIKKTLNA